MRKFKLSLLIIVVWSAVSCEMPTVSNGFSIASYNVQTLFDDRLNGGEFSEFVPSAEGWNTKKYHNRLRQLSRTIRDLIDGAPDLLVLQEVENEQVIRDLDRFFIRDLDYKYLAISTVGSQSVAVLSRIPFIESKILGVQWENRTLRPMVEVHFDVQSGTDRRIILYAVHWKSKREGAEETEVFRRASAQALVQSIRKNMDLYPLANFIVAGDFNENIDEFVKQNASYITALMPQSEIEIWNNSENTGISPLFVASTEDRSNGKQVGTSLSHSDSDNSSSSNNLTSSNELKNNDLILYHLWENDEGSFYFNGEWERIDQILFSEGFFYSYNSIEFSVADAWYLRDSTERPRRYNVASSSGYSDHLPIVLRFSLE